jgi:hypothetical protein
MCSCGKPVVNGQPGYKWQPSHAASAYPVHPPTLEDRDELLYDEPGRCGGLDSHSHHFRLVKNHGAFFILVAHGAGEERHQFGWSSTLTLPFAAMDSNGRYWVMQAAHHAIQRAAREAEQKTENMWREAAASKRIKTRRQRKPNENLVKVWIEK